MYSRAAAIFAHVLYDMLSASDIWNDPALDCAVRDRNFLMWTLIPFIAAQSGEEIMDSRITFEEAATLRPDGGHNICYAMTETDCTPMHMDSMQKWCGPCWNANADIRVWLCDSEWSDRRMRDFGSDAISRDLQLLAEWKNGGNLSKHDLAWLIQQGYLRSEDGNVLPGCIWIKTAGMKKRLFGFGNEIRRKHAAEFEALKEPYIKAVLYSTPVQMRKARLFGMQYIFYADGWFTLGCLKELVESGRLTPPAEDLRRSLTMIILPEK